MTDLHLAETRQLIAQRCEFPADSATVVEQLGEVELLAPTGDTIRIGEILDIPGETTYESPDTVYNTIIGNLGDAFIGRKYYDDRGGTETEFERTRERHSL